MDAERWLEANTICCPIGRVTPAQCEALRARPVFDPNKPGPYMPEVCMKCSGWRDKVTKISEEQKEDQELMKRCARCGKIKPASQFSKNRKSKDGLQRWCKECKRIVDMEYRKRKKAAKEAALHIQENQQAPADPVPTATHDPQGPKQLHCVVCRRQLNWYDPEKGIGFVMEHYELTTGPLCIVCFSRLYGMQGFEEG